MNKGVGSSEVGIGSGVVGDEPSGISRVKAIVAKQKKLVGEFAALANKYTMTSEELFDEVNFDSEQFGAWARDLRDREALSFLLESSHDKRKELGWWAIGTGRTAAEAICAYKEATAEKMQCVDRVAQMNLATDFWSKEIREIDAKLEREYNERKTESSAAPILYGRPSLRALPYLLVLAAGSSSAKGDGNGDSGEFKKLLEQRGYGSKSSQQTSPTSPPKKKGKGRLFKVVGATLLGGIALTGIVNDYFSNEKPEVKLTIDNSNCHEIGISLDAKDINRVWGIPIPGGAVSAYHFNVYDPDGKVLNETLTHVSENKGTINDKFSINIDAEKAGFYKIVAKAKDQTGDWGPEKNETFYVSEKCVTKAQATADGTKGKDNIIDAINKQLSMAKFSDLQLDGQAKIYQSNLTPIGSSIVTIDGDHKYNFTALPWKKPMVNLTVTLADANRTTTNRSFNLSEIGDLTGLLHYIDDLDGGNFTKKFNPGVQILHGPAGYIFTGADVGVLGGLDVLSGNMFNSKEALFARLCKEESAFAIRVSPLIRHEIKPLEWESNKTINLTYQGKPFNFSELAPDILPGAYVISSNKLSERKAVYVPAPAIALDSEGWLGVAHGEKFNHSANDLAVLYGLLYAKAEDFNGYVNANRTMPSIAMTKDTYVSNATYDPLTQCQLIGIAKDTKTLDEKMEQALRPPTSGGRFVGGAQAGGGGGAVGGYRGGESTGGEWGGK